MRRAVGAVEAIAAQAIGAGTICGVASDAEALIESGQEALRAGEWAEARSAFEAAVELEERADALHGLGTALYWLAEIEAAIRCQERAYAEFRRRGDVARAVGRGARGGGGARHLARTATPRATRVDWELERGHPYP